jgi:hypothetical protein
MERVGTECRDRHIMPTRAPVAVGAAGAVGSGGGISVTWRAPPISCVSSPIKQMKSPSAAAEAVKENISLTLTLSRMQAGGRVGEVDSTRRAGGLVIK